VNLIDALELLKRPFPEDGTLLKIFLACGFTPLHLQTLLTAHLRKVFPGHRIEIQTGLFGDLPGNIERLDPRTFDAVVVMIEWEDLDPRLGIRSLGGWRYADIPDIVDSADQRATRLQRALKTISCSVPITICMPTLPLPPMFSVRALQGCPYEFRLREIVSSLAASTSSEPAVQILSTQCLDEISPLGERFDIKSEITAGFPYKLGHASRVAELLTVLIRNPAPKKGIITDLDDTLWAGILGDAGIEGVSWDLDQHSHMHGLYQQFLASLASAGVLIGVASKNDPALVEKAFERKDLLLGKDKVFPFEISWTRKSESVRRILKVWNVGPESVVFVDDSPMEVAEVKDAFPEMECVVFPKDGYQAIWGLIRQLRDLFGKKTVSEEDSLRLVSIRNANSLRESLGVPGSSFDDFLENARATILFTFGSEIGDCRALDLINKTNQFNLNGKRLNQSAWMNYLRDPLSFMITVTYEDKYAPLGKISVLMGRFDGRSLVVSSWVMSCRAFSRRIEHQCLEYLFGKFSVEGIAFDYEATPRNGPLQEFFAQLLGMPPEPNFRLSQASFMEKKPPLFHRVEEMANG
jgi:FkbH-like protein